MSTLGDGRYEKIIFNTFSVVIFWTCTQMDQWDIPVLSGPAGLLWTIRL